MSDYERAAERIWDSPPHTTKEEIAAILREEVPEREAGGIDRSCAGCIPPNASFCGTLSRCPQSRPAPDVAALRDIAKRTFKMLDEGATLREKQELYNLCRSLLRSEPKGGSHTCRECAESGSGACIEGSLCPDFVLRSEPKEG
jgi:hypothetical protein